MCTFSLGESMDSARGTGDGSRARRGNKAPYFLKPEREGMVSVYRRPGGNRIDPKLCGTMPNRAMAAAHDQSRLWLVRVAKQLLFRKQLRRESEIMKSAYEEFANSCTAAYHQSAIYVSFRSGAAHEEQIAATVVHELAHALWEKLAGRPLTWQPKAKFIEQYQLFVEGFATYAERVWFLDLYPMAVRGAVQRSQLDPEGIHRRGYHRVEQLVRERGPEILPEIPKRWRSF
jgi:hypothetical protein